MTVKELIDELNKIENQDIDVIIKGTGPDDWVYMNDVEGYYETLVIADVEDIYEIDKDDVDIILNSSEGDDVYTVFVIDGGMF
jgi:hypothetical protein